MIMNLPIDAQAGDILEGSVREPDKARHYIIFINYYNDDGFVGCVLTSDSRTGNKKLEAKHFEAKDDNGNDWKIQYKNSYMIDGKFFKFESWGPFAQVGKLTKIGIEFVQNKIEDKPLYPFDTWRGI